MGLLRGYRERKAGKTLGQILQAGGWAAAKKYVTELPGTLRSGAWAHGAVIVANAGNPRLARDALGESMHLDGTKNSAEFFAVAYVDYLDRRWDLPTTPESDADGLLGDVFAFFDELGRGSPLVLKP